MRINSNVRTRDTTCISFENTSLNFAVILPQPSLWKCIQSSVYQSLWFQLSMDDRLPLESCITLSFVTLSSRSIIYIKGQKEFHPSKFYLKVSTLFCTVDFHWNSIVIQRKFSNWKYKNYSIKFMIKKVDAHKNMEF